MQISNLLPTTPAPKALTNNQQTTARQIAFAAAFLLPMSKLLEAPSILAKHAGGDLLFPAVLHFLFQTLVLLGLLYAASKSEIPLIDRLKNVLGKGVFILYAVYATYFLFHAALPLLDMEKFVYATYFDTAPTLFSFGVFFLFSAFVCTKGIKSIGRCADLCLFLFLLPFLALAFMAVSETDFSRLLPFFGTDFSKSFTAFTRTAPHFSDAVLLLPLIATMRYQKNDGVKVVAGYGCGAILTLFFLAVFYALYGTLAGREHYAFAKIGQYFPALSVVGRIDLLFVYFLSVVLLFFLCLPLQYASQAISQLFHTERKTLISALLNLVLFVFVLFFNRRYNSVYTLISGKLPPVFWLFADILPLFVLCIPSNQQNEGGRYAMKIKTDTKKTPIRPTKDISKENKNASNT